MAGPTIVSTVPASGATGVPTNSTVTITFDQEIDTYRLNNGGIVFSGPDQSKSIGPGFLHLEPPETNEDDFLTSPGYEGIVDVNVEFNRVDGSGNSVGYYDYGDGANAGEVYRTQAVITPKIPLASLTEYTVYVNGDEDTTDAYEFGLSNRSVFDTAKGANTGNGDILFYGGFTGAAREQFFIEITTSGISGTAEYEWWTSRDGVHNVGRSSNSYRLLKDGVYVQFAPGLNYASGDTFSVWADVPTFMDGSYKFSFVTSDHAPETLPVPSGLITGISGSTTTSATTSSFDVTETTPADREILVDVGTTEITVVFSDALDTTTITDSSVTAFSYSADESIDLGINVTGELTKTLSVSDSTVTITLEADQLYINNLVEITFDTTVTDEDGNALSSDYQFFFTTTYSPYYAGVRHVRLRLGSFGDTFTNDAVALAIWDASRDANAIAPSSVADADAFNRARNMYVVCLAAWILLSGSKPSGGGVRKRLADLDISRDGGGVVEYSNDLNECLNRYELAMRSGGEVGYGTGLKPKGVVKGSRDVDSPAFSRRWASPARGSHGNADVFYSGSRRGLRTFLKR